ncbi:MAG: CvpA family protein [Gammaproteobacteria bacterium]|nr:CvpA family protein [Gammaproteobacteria bacterium]
MNWADYFILGLIGLSMLISIWRGFIKEAISLATWIVAVLVAMTFSDPFADMLSPWIELPSARAVAGFAGLFLIVLILGALVGFLAGQLVKKTGLGGTDRVLGTVFGVARGVILVAVLVLLAGLTALPRDPWWQTSQLMPHFERVALWLTQYLPAGVADNVRFDIPVVPVDGKLR